MASKNAKNIKVSAKSAKSGTEALPYKLPTAKKFSFPKRKLAEKAAKKTAGSLSDGDLLALYAKMAVDYTLGSEVVELQSPYPERKGYVATAATEGSPWLGIRFGDSTEVEDRHVVNLKLVKKAKIKKLKPKFAFDDIVEHPAHGIGRVVVLKENSVHDVFFEGEDNSINDTLEVHQDELTLVRTAKQIAEERKLVEKAVKSEAKAQKPVKIKFENVNLFAAFTHKSQTFVKVSKSNAIACAVRGLTNEPFAVLATDKSKMNGSSVLRFKKADKVTPYENTFEEVKVFAIIE